MSEKPADLSTDSPSQFSPVAKKHELSELSIACPVVPIEQFQKHVGHHLEQLALFALPPPIKESSQTSSFKKYYASYEKQYREVAQIENPPQEKLDELMRTHTRLAELKEQIRKDMLE